MVEGNKNNTTPAGKKGSFDMKIIGGALVVVAIAIAAFVFFGQGGPSPKPPAQNATYGLNSTEAQLILASYEKAAGIGDYDVSFTQIQDGLPTNISEIRKGERAWIQLTDVFATREGFLGAGNATNAPTDIVCLSYLDNTRCAKVQNNGTIKVVNSLKAWELGNKETNLAQKDGMAKLIEAGAVKITGPAVDEKVGGFDTKKIQYAFNLQQLTVKELVALGISPDDPSILMSSTVTYWIDTATGFAVRTTAVRMQKGAVVGENKMEYAKLLLSAEKLPDAELDLVDAGTFLKFYANSQDDFLSRETCKAQPTQADVDACYKSMGVQKNDVTLCKRISGKAEAENCIAIVAQNTKNGALCAGLENLADDCYISVAGENGNQSLCNNVKNSSLVEKCQLAAAQGKQKAEAAADEMVRAASRRNCAVDSDCKVFAGVACAPKNATNAFSNASNPYIGCFQGVPCGCSSGFCAFSKNETYYQCVGGVEEQLLKDFIGKKADEANRTGGNLTIIKTNTSA